MRSKSKRANKKLKVLALEKNESRARVLFDARQNKEQQQQKKKNPRPKVQKVARKRFNTCYIGRIITTPITE